MLKLLLEMNECPGRLNQSFEIIRVFGSRAQPEMFEDVVRFVILPLIPAAKKGAIEMVPRNVSRINIRVAAALEALHEFRNPLAFAHGALNFGAAEMIGKHAGFTFSGDRRWCDRRRSEK